MKIRFVIADYTSSGLTGIGTLALIFLMVGEGWNVLLAMVVGMGVGLLVMLIVLVAFIRVSTFFERFPVGMVIAMVTGMVAGMNEAMVRVDFISILMGVITFSVLAQLSMNLYDLRLKGEVVIER